MNFTIENIDGQLMDGLEFCSRVYALFEHIRSEPGAMERLRLRSEPGEKRLLEELLPICRYVQTYYRAGRYISVRWVNGSQSYDAELHQHGSYVDQGYCPQLAYLEVTCAMHENEHWIWTLLSHGEPAYAPEGIDAKKGTPLKSEPVVFTGFEHVENFVPIVVAAVRKKSEIHYPENTSLVVQCHLNSLYMPDEWRRLVAEVERQIIGSPFREILLLDVVTERSTPIVTYIP